MVKLYLYFSEQQLFWNYDSNYYSAQSESILWLNMASFLYNVIYDFPPSALVTLIASLQLASGMVKPFLYLVP